MGLKPLGKRVIILPREIDRERHVEGGSVIHLPQTAKGRSNEGTVVLVANAAALHLLHDEYGPDLSAWSEDADLGNVLKAGDRVLFLRYAAVGVNYRGAAHLVVDVEDIIAIVDADEAAEATDARPLSSEETAALHAAPLEIAVEA